MSFIQKDRKLDSSIATKIATTLRVAARRARLSPQPEAVRVDLERSMACTTVSLQLCHDRPGAIQAAHGLGDHDGRYDEQRQVEQAEGESARMPEHEGDPDQRQQGERYRNQPTHTRPEEGQHADRGNRPSVLGRCRCVGCVESERSERQ